MKSNDFIRVTSTDLQRGTEDPPKGVQPPSHGPPGGLPQGLPRKPRNLPKAQWVCPPLAAPKQQPGNPRTSDMGSKGPIQLFGGPPWALLERRNAFPKPPRDFIWLPTTLSGSPQSLQIQGCPERLPMEMITFLYGSGSYWGPKFHNMPLGPCGTSRF